MCVHTGAQPLKHSIHLIGLACVPGTRPRKWEKN